MTYQEDVQMVELVGRLHIMGNKNFHQPKEYHLLWLKISRFQNTKDMLQ